MKVLDLKVNFKVILNSDQVKEIIVKLFTPLTLPNGSVLPNRLAKAAMEENMADKDHAPSSQILRLYQKWAEGEVGLILTGNVMVDGRAMTGPGGIVLEDERHLDRFQRWSQVARSRGAQVWMQISHPGRQVPAALGQQAWAPSAIALEMGSLSKQFSMPKEMSETEIREVIRRFEDTARLAEKSGFNGVQIHAAHGYLLSQFLSPLSNKRKDRWGGSLENRARLLVEILRGVRNIVSSGFAVSVKLNSADFQRGGFSPDDAKRVISILNDLKVDLVELSGGSYEAPAMQGMARDGRTLAREAYFLEYAKMSVATAKMPLMVTGGIRRREVAEHVIESGIAMAGIASALSIDPNLPIKWRTSAESSPAFRPINWNSKPLASAAGMAMVKFQLERLSHGRSPNPNVSPVYALVKAQLDFKRKAWKYRRWVGQTSQFRAQC